MLFLQPFARTKDLQPGAVDQDVCRPCGQCAHLGDRLQAHGASTHRAVIGRLQVQLQQIKDRCHQAFGLAQCLAKHQAQHQAGRDCQIRVETLPARGTARLGRPYSHRFGRDPHGQAATCTKCRVIFAPVAHRILHLRNMVAALGVVLVGHAADSLILQGRQDYQTAAWASVQQRPASLFLISPVVFFVITSVICILLRRSRPHELIVAWLPEAARVLSNATAQHAQKCERDASVGIEKSTCQFGDNYTSLPASLCVCAPIPLHQKFCRAVPGKKVVGRSRGECFRISVGAPAHGQPNLFRVNIHNSGRLPQPVNAVESTMETSTSRVFWKGAISFGLVHIPVALHSATSESGLDFDWLDKRTMDPIGYKRINKKTGKEVEKENIVKGISYDEGHYVVLTEDEIKAALPKSTQTIEIESFVSAAEIPLVFVERPYYLAPIGKGDKVYALLREALVKSRRVGIARVVIQTKQHLAALMPDGPALVLILLRWASEIRSIDGLNLPSSATKSVKLTTPELSMATQLIEDMSAPWKPERFKDEFAVEVMALVKKKAKAGQTEFVSQPEVEPGNTRTADIIDLTALLQRSLRGGTTKSSTAGKTRSTGSHGAKQTSKSKAASRRRSA